MAKKGQAELIVIVALMVVIAAVVVTQMNLFVMPEETPDVRTVRESVEGLVRTAALDTIDTMSANGGYLSYSGYQLDSVVLYGNDVPYWQQGGQVIYPDKATNLQAGVQAYLEENKDSLADALGNVTLGDPMVGTPTFTDDSITLSVTMPTTYKGTPVTQPYTVTVESHFSEIYEFSKGFAAYEVVERPFEYFTLSSMAMSPMDNGHRSIPMYEVLVGCGDSLFVSSWDVMPDVESTIVKTLARTYMPGKVPEGTITTSSSPKYSLVPINGREYQDLSVSFLLPDGFGLDSTSFRMSPDPASGVAEPIPMTGECISQDPVTVDYGIEYPAIVSVTDPETGSVFQFAVEVSITDNAPTQWGAAAGTGEDTQTGICSDPSCILEMEVLDSSGSPIEAAAVSFMGCYLGRTDGTGYLATLAPCGSGSLYIHKSGYGDYIDSRNSGQLEGTVTLYRKPVMSLVAHEVEVQDMGSGSYMVYYGDVLPLGEDSRVYVTLRSQEDFSEHSFYLEGPAITVSTVPAGDYYVSGSLTSTDLTSLYGGFGYPFTVTEDMGEMHVYIPTNPALASMTDEVAQRQKMVELSQVLYECGMGPVADSGYVQEEACSVTLA